MPDTLRAIITCSSTPCQIGDAYVLNYYGHVPQGDPSGFGGVWFTLHLEGTIAGGTSRPRVVIRVDGGNQQECASHDGTSMTVNADIAVPEGDELASIDWTLDGESIGNSAQLVHIVPLGTHTLAAEVQTLAGLSAASTSTLVVRDTQPPVISAAFIDRLELRGPEMLQSGHLGIYGQVDIALDTFPYNGTTTTCEALWMGVPVVTMAGAVHASRVGASLLAQVGLDHLVTHTTDDYIRCAARLAADIDALAHLRASLRERIVASPLCDEKGFAAAVEDAYRTTWRAWCERRN